MRKLNLLFILACLFSAQCSHDRSVGVYNILDSGALPDGSVQTNAIQRTINECAEEGGGTVLIPPGEFITGAIQLKSNVTLKLENGALLKGSLDTADYLIDGIRHGMIYAQHARNISILGNGILDGNGTAFMIPDRSHVSADFGREFTRQGENFMPEDTFFEDGPLAYNYRPGMMAVFLSCENITIRDVTFRDSPEWTIRFGECDNVMVEGISIYNNLMIPNSDGIHCTASRNIRIADCDIRAGDDAIIVTGFPNAIGVDGDNEERDQDLGKDRIGNNSGFAENVTVTNCVLQSRSAGIRIGYGSIPIRRCVFENIVIYGSNRGIGIFARDHADISQIQFNQIVIQTRLHSGHWWGNGEPVHISAIPQNSNIPVGKISDVSISNITAEAETGMVIYAHESGLVENIRLENVLLRIGPGKYVEEYGGNLDLRPSMNKEFSIFKYDLPGLLIKNIQHLKVKNFDLSWMHDIPAFYENGIKIEGSSDIRIREFSGREPHIEPDQAALFIERSSGVLVEDCYAKPGTDTFIRLIHDQGSIRFINNDLTHARKRISR